MAVATDSPPGFTDAPPAAPTSATTILSGGILLTDTPISDSVVVITNGAVIAWGRRGEVELPNDSIGIDMRGKWIRPATTLSSGSVADLEVFAQYPGDESVQPIGDIKSVEINLP